MLIFNKFVWRWGDLEYHKVFNKQFIKYFNKQFQKKYIFKCAKNWGNQNWGNQKLG
jgi:hypothetical protein